MTSKPSRAIAETLPRLSPVWLIPLAALLIGLWLAFDHLSGQGPTITLKMDDAEGIEAGKTAIKTRSVQVGTVESVSLSEDLRHTLVTARMQDGSDRMLNEDTRFWVVKPRIGREGISGLGTVLSGAYIELLPGDSDEKKRRFTVEDQPPVTEAGAEGLYLTLFSEPGNSVTTGDPITFRSLTVGRVVETEFLADEKRIRHRIFVEQPYDVLVTDTTRFWSVSGVGFQLDTQGFRVNLQSLETLLGGGVSFGVPDDTMPAGTPAEDGREYTLYPDQEAARRGLFDQYLEYVLLVEDTVRGLRRGAPVEYRGVRVGTVEQVPWRFTAEQPDSLNRFSIPVLIRIEPQRIAGDGDVLLDDWRRRMERMFQRGMRASLKSGNLLTGALFVDVQVHRMPRNIAMNASRTCPSSPPYPAGWRRSKGRSPSFWKPSTACRCRTSPKAWTATWRPRKAPFRKSPPPPTGSKNCSADRTCSACPAASTTRCPPWKTPWTACPPAATAARSATPCSAWKKYCATWSRCCAPCASNPML